MKTWRGLIAATATLCLGLAITPQGRACCSTAPARFSSTRGLAAEVLHSKKVYHLLGYQNTAQNLVAPKSGGNALLLPIPAVPNSMGPANILDTSSGPNILKDMESLVVPRSKGGRGRSLDSTNSVQVFSHDIYTIVLATDARAIEGALAKVPPNRRPALNPKIFAQYQEWYPGWTFALCCFDTREQTEAKPMLWYYLPKDPKHLFFPALDAHDGNPPKLGVQVDTDHSLMISSYRVKANSTLPVVAVSYSDKHLSAELKSWLPEWVAGSTFRTPMRNGDFVMDIDDVRRGWFKPQRVDPPGAKAK